jgi:hypothetical protein
VGGSAGTGGSQPGGPGGTTPGRDASPPPPLADDPTPFVGRWKVTGGAETFDCEKTGISTEPVEDLEFRLVRGGDAPLWQLLDPCTFRLDIRGSQAIYRSMPPCTFAEGESATVITPGGGTIAVSGEDAVMSARFTNMVREPGLTESCKISVEVRARRMP